MRRRSGRLDRLGAAVDVLERGAREPADHGVLGAFGDLVDGGEIAVRGDRKAGFDDVDAHLVEQRGDFELLLVRHGRAGALLAVAQGGVENDDAVLLGLGWSGHGSGPSRLRPAPDMGFWALVGSVASGQPLSAQAQTPSRPSGGDKEQEPAENEGSAGTSLAGCPFDRIEIVANRHALPSASRLRRTVKTALSLKAAAVVTDRSPAAQDPCCADGGCCDTIKEMTGRLTYDRRIRPVQISGGLDPRADFGRARPTAVKWRANKELIRKHYIAGENGAGGAFYIWPSKEAAQRGHNAEWLANIKKRTGSTPVITLFRLADDRRQRGRHHD